MSFLRATLLVVAAWITLAPTSAHADSCDVNRSVINCATPPIRTSVNVGFFDWFTQGWLDTDRYGSCSSGSYANEQDAWLFTCQFDGRVRIQLFGNDCNVDLFVLKDSCEGSACIAGSTNGSNSGENLEFACKSGSIYYILIERKDSEFWPWEDCTRWENFDYGLQVRCYEECNDGLDNDLDGKVDCLDEDCPVCFEECQDLRDNDFDGLVDCDDPDCRSAPNCCDADSDGFIAMKGLCGGNDCDDGNNLVNPGAVENIADGIDSNCDNFELCYVDNDGDGYGQSIVVKSLNFTCKGPGIAPIDGDCDDTNPDVFPNRPEIPVNGRDDNCDERELCYLDGDGDDFGADLLVETADLTCLTGNVSTNNDDCDDDNELAYPGATEIPLSGVDEDCDGQEICRADRDGDGYGDPNRLVNTAFVNCQGPGVTLDDQDCNDDPALGGNKINPGAVERVADGVDSNCDGLETCYIDVDNDTYGNDDGRTADSPSIDCSARNVADNATDCDDNDATTYPGAPDPQGDGKDQSCDGLQDCYQDLDGDNWGSAIIVSSAAPGCVGAGVSPNTGDCNDNNRAINPAPSTQEVPDDGVDQNCDGLELCWLDLDGDGIGRNSTGPTNDFTCNATPGFSTRNDDCNDNPPLGAQAYPGNIEIPLDGIDNNCDGFELCYEDADADGFGKDALKSTRSIACDTAGVSINKLDCNDADFRIKPGASERPADGIDQDCDTRELCYEDKDNDKFGVPQTKLSTDFTCLAAGVAKNDDDCDDNDPLTYPGAPVPPGAPAGDYSCTGLTTCYQDLDGDGYGRNVTIVSNDPTCRAPQGGVPVSPNADDCNDNNNQVKPGAIEKLGDDLDQDCDGFELCYQDLDGDRFGSPIQQLSTDITCNSNGVSRVKTDCDDNPATGAQTYPGAPEIPVSGKDESCDGFETCYEDLDRDGYGSTKTISVADLDCIGVTATNKGYADNNTDCADDAPNRNPGKTEIPVNRLDEDCDGADLCYIDIDGDGFGRAETISSPYGLSCTGAGVAQNGTDCLDVDPAGKTVYPGAPEIFGDGIDQNCDGKEVCFVDNDRDKFGGSATRISSSLLCQEPDLSLKGGDCNDGDPLIKPDAVEIPADRIDQNCDGKEDCYQDVDRDKYGTTILLASTDLTCAADGVSARSDDCYDVPPEGGKIYPGAPEVVGNGLDDDCDGKESCYFDEDRDGWGVNVVIPTNAIDCKAPGFSLFNTDCNDKDPLVNPGADEIPADGKDQNCDLKESCYRDQDGDKFGTSVTVTSTSLTCTAAGTSNNANDCNDVLPGGNFIYPGAPEIRGDGVDQDCDGTEACFTDIDGDGFGGGGTVTTPSFTCNAPQAARVGGDCNDADKKIYPGATEIVANSIDEDCDTFDSCWQDLDKDGFGSSVIIVGNDLFCVDPGEASINGDCLDVGSLLGVRSFDVNPDADEVCNQVDDDCDGKIDDQDDDVLADLYWYPDVDKDGWGDPTRQIAACTSPTGTVGQVGDCNDEVATINPDAVEKCDPANVDEDCNGFADDLDKDSTGKVVATGTVTVAPDADKDGFGSTVGALTTCEPPTGWIADTRDCRDDLAAVNPNAAERPYNGIDDDCNPLTPDDDLDGDGYTRRLDGDCNDNVGSGELVNPGADEGLQGNGIDDDCDGKVDEGTNWGDDDGDGYSEVGGDCDDANPTRYPGATELGNTVDDDCDGIVDEGTPRKDDDGDGFSENQGDCNDNDPTVFPGPISAEIPDNGKDDNCDGSVDGGTYDPDGDGYTEAGGDCNEGNANVYPGAPETPNNVDDDCDGIVDEGTSLRDDDGDGFSETDGDCDDANELVFPGQVDVPDGIDNDCDREIDEGSNVSDDDGDGFSEREGDCDDANKDLFPGQVERPNGIDDDCDGLIDETTEDVDGDGYTVAEGDCDDENGWANPGQAEVCDQIDNDCDGQVDEADPGEKDPCTGDQVKDTGEDGVTPVCGVAGGPRGAAWLLALATAGLIRRRRAA